MGRVLVEVVLCCLKCYDNRVSLTAQGWMDLRFDFLKWLYALQEPRVALNFLIAYHDDSHVLNHGGGHRIPGTLL